MANGMQGKDITAGFRAAADDMAAVRLDLKEIASDGRLNILEGDSRKKFLTEMTAEEFGILHSTAMASGPRGLLELEKMLREAGEMMNETVVDEGEE